MAVELTTRAAVTPSSVNVELRTVEVVFSTGADVLRTDWATGEPFVERLSMLPNHVDLSRLKKGAPLLDSHQTSGGVAAVLGVVQDARIDGGKGIATLRFSSRHEVDGIFQDVRDGVLRSVSIGYQVRAWKRTPATAKSHEIRVAIDWVPHEVSLVSVPADPDSQTRNAPRGQEKTEMPEAIEETPKPSAVSAERSRVAEIDRLCNDHNVSSSQRTAWLTGGADTADVREFILAGIERRTADADIHVTAGDGYREQSLVRDASDALARRAGLDVQGDGHRHFGDAKLLSVAARCLEANGVSTRTLSGSQLAERAMASTDFQAILGAAGDRIVRDAYQATPLAHRAVFKRTTANDFRTKHSISNASAALLPEVPEGGAYTMHATSAEKASYALKTYGGLISITRQMLVNDDFGMVESAAMQRGRSAAETERHVVWTYVGSNPLAPDGVAMFDDAGHGNFPSASGTPISADTLGAARTALRTALSPDGYPVNGMLKHVIVAPGGEVAFDQLINGLWVPTGAGSAMTPSLRAVELHVEPLVSSDKSHWYAFTDHRQVSHFEFAYLSGAEGPQLSQRMNFSTDALELRVVLDFGIGAIDPRGTYYQRET